jgi:hypothetical protein
MKTNLLVASEELGNIINPAGHCEVIPAHNDMAY